MMTIPTLCLKNRIRTLALLLSLAAGLQPVLAGKPKGLETGAYPRVAVWVCRMADQNGLLPDIKPETDYAVRTPTGKAAAWLDDEARLKAAFPDYPFMSRNSVPKIETRFWGNLTSPVAELVQSLLRERGRTVLDLRQLAAAWPKAPFEMSVKDIVKGLEGQADALLLVHYVDRGDNYYDCVSARRVDKGFSSICVVMALFDVATGKKLGQVTTGFNPMAVLANDPSVRDDPAQKDMIRIIDPADLETSFERGFLISQRRNLFSRSTSVTLVAFNDDELLNRALRYLREGFKGPQKLWDFPGIAELLK